MDQESNDGRRVRRLLILAGAGLAILVLAVVWASSRDESQDAAGGSGASPAPAASQPTVGASPTASSGATVEPSTGADSPSASGTATAEPQGNASATPAPTALETVPVQPLESQDPVDLSETADFGTGLTAEIVDLRAVTGVARVQGEIAGPALWTEVRVRNDTEEAISLATAQVEVTYGPDRTPGVALSGPDLTPFPASLAPGKSATGAFVYGVPLDARDRVQIVFFLSTDAPVVVFEGSAP